MSTATAYRVSTGEPVRAFDLVYAMETDATRLVSMTFLCVWETGSVEVLTAEGLAVADPEVVGLYLRRDDQGPRPSYLD